MRSPENSDSPPDGLPAIHVVFNDSRDPWVRKTAGAKAATAPIIAFLDADCVPENGWLGSMLEVFRFFPEVAVVRGPVEKDGIDWRKLVLPDRRAAGPTAVTADNNVAFRRDAYLDYPFREGMGSDAVGLQSAALRKAHYVLWMNPSMQVVRGRDLRKPPVAVRLGYSTAASR